MIFGIRSSIILWFKVLNCGQRVGYLANIIGNMQDFIREAMNMAQSILFMR